MRVTSVDVPQVAVYPPGAVLSARTLADSEFVWMLHGTATLLGPDGASWPLVPGQLLLVPPGLQHTFVWDRERTSSHGYVHFAVDPRPRSPTAPVVAPMGATDPAAALCRFLLDVGARPPEARAVMGSAVRVLLDVVLSPSASGGSDAAAPPAVSLAIAHLRAAWTEMPLRRVPVAELARACHLSPSQLTRVFGAWFDAAPATVLEQARLARAEQLLLRSDLPVASIARACGFADASHLTHRFLAVHGVPPGRFRSRLGPPIQRSRSPRLGELVTSLWSEPPTAVGAAQSPR